MKLSFEIVLYGRGREASLYTVRFGEVKTGRTFQEDDCLLQAVREMQYVDGRLRERMDFGDVWIENRELCGRLTFDREDVL